MNERVGITSARGAALIAVALLLVLTVLPPSSAATVFTNNVQLTSATGSNDQMSSQIALDSDGQLHVTWWGYNPTTGAPHQIWYSESLTTPTVTTTSVTSVGMTGATLHGNITDTGGDYCDTRGFQYRKSGASGWTDLNDQTPDPFGTGTYSLPVTGLDPGTNYEFKAVAHNSVGWGYGGILTFTTVKPQTKPVVDSLSPSSGPVGTRVTLTGANFGPSQGTSTVMVGGVPAEVVSWSNDKIIIVIPPGASSGAVVVTTTSGSSNTDKQFQVVSDLSTWYLPEGSTDHGFDCYITIENPNTSSVTARITYMTGSGSVTAPSVSLPAKSQATINPRDVLGNKGFSTKVVCKEGKQIAVDRTMSWTGPGATAPEAHSSIGVTSPSKTWYLAEGSSKWGFECWLLIQNPNASAANCIVTYMIEGQGPKTVTKTVPANSRKTFFIADDIGQADASIKVEGNIPVIPERAMYRNNRREGHDSIGTTSPNTNFYLAEGTSAYGFTTYVLIQNPNSTPTDVTVTYMTGAGPKPQAPFTMDPNSRKTIRVNDVSGMGSVDFSTQVHGSKPIIAERAMYWDNGTGEACHDSVGMDKAHTSFYLPDGQTSEGRETYTLVQNPNSTPVTVEISYMTPNGAGNVVFPDSIPANSRKTYNMADKGIGGRAAIMVTSKTAGKKIMCERAMYWNARGAGTDTIGGYGD